MSLTRGGWVQHHVIFDNGSIMMDPEGTYNGVIMMDPEGTFSTATSSINFKTLTTKLLDIRFFTANLPTLEIFSIDLKIRVVVLRLLYKFNG